MLDISGGFAEYAGWKRCLCWLAMLSGNADYFLYVGSLYWLDGYASYADCLAMLAKLAGCLSWLYWLGSYSGYVLWLEILAVLDGGLCCISWLAMFVGCLAMPAIHASWLAISAFLPGFLYWHSFLAAVWLC
jgi:hypothetical protein